MHLSKVKDRYFDSYGMRMQYTDINGDMTQFSAFLQPLRYKNKMYLGGARTELGFEGKKMFLLIYPAAVVIENYRSGLTSLKDSSYCYLVDRAESVGIGGKTVYNWAIVQRGGASDGLRS